MEDHTSMVSMSDDLKNRYILCSEYARELALIRMMEYLADEAQALGHVNLAGRLRSAICVLMDEAGLTNDELYRTDSRSDLN